MNPSWYVDNKEKLTYEEYCDGLEICLEIVRRTQDPQSIRNELSSMRSIYGEEYLMYLEDQRVFKVSEPFNLTKDEQDLLEMYNFYTQDTHHFLLKGRYLVEVRDASGRLITLIGYYKDQRKYITIATKYFSKKIDWFNIDEALPLSLNQFDGKVFVVEGIFDAMSLKSLGLPVIATMGISVGTLKAKTLSLFDKCIIITDGDEAGQRALRKWEVPDNSLKVKLDLSIPVKVTEKDENGTDVEVIQKVKIKDIEELIKFLDPYGVRENLLELSDSKSFIEIIN